MKTAICISGELRSIDQCWTIWESTIFSALNDYDIFYYDYIDDPDIHKLNVLIKTNKLKDILLEKRPLLDESAYKTNKRDEVNIQGMLRQLDCLKKCNILKTQYEKQHGFVYDCVIRLRPDIKLLTNDVIDFDGCDMNKLWVCDHDQWHGYNDRFYFSSSQNMDIVSDRIDQLGEYYKLGGVIHYETFMKYIVLINDIEVDYLPIKTCLLRTNGDLNGELVVDMHKKMDK